MRRIRTHSEWSLDDEVILYNEITKEISEGSKVADALELVQMVHFPDKTLDAVRLRYYKVKSTFEAEGELFPVPAPAPVTKDKPNVMGIPFPKPLEDLVVYVAELAKENAKMKEELAELDELRGIKAEWEQLMVIMGKARAMAVGDTPKSKFKMDANGNLERIGYDDNNNN